ncbi:aminodeoxychorismate synthase component I [Undibacterium flavidum]|uniref:Aminodeoxychorismate synthase component I n=1 Tax=Undibacterium flavidum TaxID=2762297 RepID=A0ABR6YF90_9BURK|nr:aminodeoxychorismate synthase component I [Undibacterium flavidum]MBC3875212.1 aminodeoxychorismate synthase component I [Undibacterium flavidum]
MSASSLLLSNPDSANLCFALLDDAQSDVAQSRFYSDLIDTLSSSSAETWPAMWQQAEQALSNGYYVLAVLSYESGAQLHAITAREQAETNQTISQLLVFRDCQHWSRQQVAERLTQACTNEVAGIRQLRANVDQAEFTQAINQIRAYIAAGDTYQVNYTYRLHFSTYGTALALYRALRKRQPVPFAAFISLPDGRAILSLSPELFIRHQAGQLLAKPMKGTAAASGDAVQDQQRAQQLSHDPKNRAENLMIVDLLRNDLGRIAQTGTVKVPALFEVQSFTSVLQMTSTITAQLRSDLRLDAVMSALFPCGSITGAPKHRTMEIIREIETEDRGIYTGAIGWFDPPATPQSVADFCLSVPIRTLTLQAPDANACRVGVMGVGAGIVYDSQPDEEFAECQLKAKFLTGMQPDFELFETMYTKHDIGYRHLERHLARLQASAAFFEFKCEPERILLELQNYQQHFAVGKEYRLKLSLKSNGDIAIQHAELRPLEQPVRIFISAETCTTAPVFLAHKSTHRAQYDQAWQDAEKHGGFDSLFCNTAGKITEGGRSNVFVKIRGNWYTPPLNDGVLPGIMRSVLLEDAQLQAIEKSLTLNDLQQADEILVCNALRGVLKATLVLPTLMSEPT